MHKIIDIFPTPIYVTKRETELTSFEIADIKELGENKEKENYKNKNEILAEKNEEKISETYIFDTKLDSLKKFCEDHIDSYVNEVINPRNTELDFYITQSWLNIVHPGESHEIHIHPNSIISGIFYVSTVEGDAVQFYDINANSKTIINIEPGESNFWNVSQQSLDITNNVLLLFPSWLGHGVKQNISKISNRMSISFNVFVKGTIGEYYNLNALHLR